LYAPYTARIYDLLYSSNGGRLRDAQGEVDRILHEIRARNPRARSLLDVGCGTGRLLCLLDGEMDVYGIDLDASLLEVARTKCPDAVLQQADMKTFRLGRRFDAVICMFSTIAYATTEEGLRSSVARIADHLAPGGVVVIEPWFTPETFWHGHVSAHWVDTPEVKVAWAYRQVREGEVSRLDVHYLVTTAEGVEHFTERHELGLYTHETYLSAMADVGLTASWDPDGFNRGLYVAVSDA
jgi:SAM-dependent methyltransferase